LEKNNHYSNGTLLRLGLEICLILVAAVLAYSAIRETAASNTLIIRANVEKLDKLGVSIEKLLASDIRLREEIIEVRAELRIIRKDQEINRAMIDDIKKAR